MSIVDITTNITLVTGTGYWYQIFRVKCFIISSEKFVLDYIISYKIDQESNPILKSRVSSDIMMLHAVGETLTRFVLCHVAYEQVW